MNFFDWEKAQLSLIFRIRGKDAIDFVEKLAVGDVRGKIF